MTATAASGAATAAVRREFRGDAVPAGERAIPVARTVSAVDRGVGHIVQRRGRGGASAASATTAEARRIPGVAAPCIARPSSMNVHIVTATRNLAIDSRGLVGTDSFGVTVLSGQMLMSASRSTNHNTWESMMNATASQNTEM